MRGAPSGAPLFVVAAVGAESVAGADATEAALRMSPVGSTAFVLVASALLSARTFDRDEKTAPSFDPRHVAG
jgi:hypothetical protein